MDLMKPSLGHVYFHQDYTVCFKDPTFKIPTITSVVITFKDSVSGKTITLTIEWLQKAFNLHLRFGNEA
jgi:hypothetical protein